jgi:hypothetical membrane protein
LLAGGAACIASDEDRRRDREGEKMSTANRRIVFGLIGATLLALGVAGLAFMVPGYDHVRQTVSEIGEAGSPAQTAFTILLAAVALCLAVFASGLRAMARAERRAAWAAWLVAAMAVSVVGVGVFSHPHPLHNVFGLSELIGYQAPAAFALAYRRAPDAQGLVAFSWIAYGAVVVAIALNLSGLAPEGPVWRHVEPAYGVVQRALFASWFGWCAGVSVMLALRRRVAAAVGA